MVSIFIYHPKLWQSSNSIINVRTPSIILIFPYLLSCSHNSTANNIYPAWLVGGSGGSIIFDGRGFIQPPSLKVIVIRLEMKIGDEWRTDE